MDMMCVMCVSIDLSISDDKRMAPSLSLDLCLNRYVVCVCTSILLHNKYGRRLPLYYFHLTVFNRWGEIVWESYNPEGMWDGTYGSTESKTGTYVWVIEAKDKFSDKKLEWRGHVTVLK